MRRRKRTPRRRCTASWRMSDDVGLAGRTFVRPAPACPGRASGPTCAAGQLVQAETALLRALDVIGAALAGRRCALRHNSDIRLLADAAVTARRYDTAFRRPPVHRDNRVLDARDAAAGAGAHGGGA